MIFLFHFYRFPKRHNNIFDQNSLYSVCDGKVMLIKNNKNNIRISCFLSPTDVHVQYSPIDAKLISYEYIPGSFYLANTEQARNNEKMETIWMTRFGKIKIEQYAGFFVRRILLWKKPGSVLKTGQPFGMIKFGSRVDVIIPKISNGKLANVLVKKNERVRAGLNKIVEYV